MFTAITFLFCILAGRFFYVQVVWSGQLGYRALDQWMREIPVVAERGLVTDRNGVVLAENNTSYTVFARSNAVKDKTGTARLLSDCLGVDGDTLLKKLESVKASEITVARHVGKGAIETLAEANPEGVYYSRDNTRVYPKGDSLCQVLGFTSTDNSGTTGIEKYYDKYLAGTNGELLYETDLVGVNLKGAVAAYRPAEDGMNVKLTVDYGIQSVCESVMAKAFEEHSPVSAECIVLDPDTFEILAMANYPGYDLNDVPRDETELLNSLSRNRIVCDIYEPGSTFKVVTAAADIEESLRGNRNAFSTSYVFPSSRTRSVDGTTVKCWSNHANGKHCNQTLADALNNSCNPCFTDIALALGTSTFYDYLSAFGFGKTTGIDYSGEALGMLLPETAVRDCDLARIGFGQTIAVSGIQLACATAAAVNGGYYYTPHLVKSIYASDGYVLQDVEKTLKNRTISEKASSTLAAMLEGVVRDGSGKKAYIEGYRVGGKTGTAQKYEDGHIAAGKYVSSFVGFFPADNPQYLALVIIDEPQGAYYGSSVAAPCAKEIFEGIIALKNIQPYQSE
ncbi:MAG: peptidoglycan D,D-transpeptidase FtsI family protein [Christensenellaceae bacterium]|nr:MAG: stage V sporulation protein D [Clostridiales bacterium]